MAWTTPRTWVASELVTATLLNTHLRDNLNALKSPSVTRKTETAGTFTTSSTSFVTVTNGEIELVTTGGHLLVFVSGTLTANTGLIGYISLLLDDKTRWGSATDGLQRVTMNGSAAAGFATSYVGFSGAISAANHTIALQVKTSTGFLGVPQFLLWAMET